jgi:hypothetical protein
LAAIIYAPVIIFGLIALFTYSNNEVLAIALLILGVIFGVLLAEFIRKKYGLEKFFARLYSNEQDKSGAK